jgi:hypothetical protein
MIHDPNFGSNGGKNICTRQEYSVLHTHFSDTINTTNGDSNA